MPVLWSYIVSANYTPPFVRSAPTTMDELWPYVIVALVVSLVPVLVAFARGAQHKGPIAVISLLLGWTVVGWLAAFIWACVSPNKFGKIRVRTPRGVVSMSVEKKCPECAEMVRREARSCKHCGYIFVVVKTRMSRR